ncbi:MAG: sigma-70 family RNA polymerase sigma factor [Myxococcota bacterium]
MYPSQLNGYSERRIEGLSREETCRRYQRKILLLARRISERLPPGCELGTEDLASFGAIGLLEAFDRFDEDRDILFTTFAEYRIRGAMMDALRATDSFTRHRRQMSKQVLDAQKVLTGELGRPPEATEVARRLDMDMDTYWRVMDRVKPVSHVRIDDADGPDGEEGGGRSFSETIQDDNFRDAFSSILHVQARDLLKEAIEGLSGRKKECVLLYYGRDMNLSEVASAFDVTPSRISQILSEARVDLRKSLSGVIGVGDLEYREAL